MPLVMTALAPGFAGHEDPTARRQRRPPDAALSRLRGPVTVNDGAVERTARFALTAFSPLLFNTVADRGD